MRKSLLNYLIGLIIGLLLNLSKREEIYGLILFYFSILPYTNCVCWILGKCSHLTLFITCSFYLASQDYLGGVIVFIAIVASLVTASLYPNLITSSLVGLAVNYTLLVPIYLNWVVKFLTDMEMYMSAVERVHQYSLTPTEDYRKNGT